jgi:K+-sensing histidine kinase KdpD
MAATRTAITADVLDHGPGLDPALCERLTAAAARGAVQPGEPGFGLGLPLVITHVTRAGGRLTVLRNGPDGLALRIEVPR